MNHLWKFFSFEFLLFCTSVDISSYSVLSYKIAHNFTFINCPTKQSAEIDSTYEVRCEISITSHWWKSDWWKGDWKIDPHSTNYDLHRSRHKIFQDGLIIRNVEPSDAGVYLCIIENKLNQVLKRNITLEVTGPPPKIGNCSNGNATVGGFGQIQCEIQAFLKPVIYYRKIGDNEYITRTHQRLNLEINPTSKKYTYITTLSFLNVDIVDAGWFEFRAYNQAGRSNFYAAYLEVHPSENAEATKIIKVESSKPPDKPIFTNPIEPGAKFVKVNTTKEIKLTWKIPSNNGHDITGYLLTCCIAFRNRLIDELYYYSACIYENLVVDKEPLSSYVMESLGSNTYHFVTLRAYNIMGEGPASEQYFKTRVGDGFGISMGVK